VQIKVFYLMRPVLLQKQDCLTSDYHNKSISRAMQPETRPGARQLQYTC
jgi:hypothetical protein